MARTRGHAFLATGKAEICAVASQHVDTARSCAAELNCEFYSDDFRSLSEKQPDAILIETPHYVQDKISVWALEENLDLLIGGSLASCVRNGNRVLELARERGKIVEAGYQRRYDPAWIEIRQLIQRKVLGKPIIVTSMAFWDPSPNSWYYSQQYSGGMPVTHLSYCYLNSIRWILGIPETVAAMANRKAQTDPELVLEETCSACISFEDGALYSAVGSYTKPNKMSNADTRFVCSDGGIQVHENSITVFRQGEKKEYFFKDKPSPFVYQAEAFLQAIESREGVQNPPEDAILDLKIAAAISLSAQKNQTVHLHDNC